MNILVLSHYFPPEVTAGANRTYEHAMRWAKKGINVTVITNNPNHPRGILYPGYNNKWIQREIVDGITVIRVKTILTPNKGVVRRGLNFFVYFLMSILASFHVKKVDIILSTSPQILCGLAGVLIKRIRNKPFVLEIRDLWPDSIVAVDALANNKFIGILKKLEKFLYNEATHIVPVVNKFEDHFNQLGIALDKITTIPNAVDFDKISKVKECKNLFLKKNRFICSYIGTFGMAHKLETVINCAKILEGNENIHFLLIGDGSDRKNILDKTKQLKLENVTVLNQQSKKNIPYFYKISDIGLVVLKNNDLFKDALPSKMFEYLGARMPVLLSMPKGQASRLVRDVDCGYWVEPEEHKLMASTIMEIFRNKDRLVSQGNNGYHYVYKNYNRDTNAIKMLKIFEELI